MSEEKLTQVTEELEAKEVSRRKFVTGALVAGATAATGLMNVAPALASSAVKLKINGKFITSTVPPTITKGTTIVPARVVTEAFGCKVDWDSVTRTVTVESQEVGFPYKKLDVEKVRKSGYDGYITKGKGCMYGAAYGLINVLREEVGYPWTILPMDAFKYGLGGATVGSLCGAQNGALFVMGLITGNDINKTDNNLMKKLNDWYTATELPLNDKHSAWATIAVSEPLKSATVDCRDSKDAWCTKFNHASGSNEQKQRCGKLTGDVCAKAVEILNEWFDAQNK